MGTTVRQREEKLDRALKDSFPASDTPAASVPTTADRLPDGVIEVPDDRHPTKVDDNDQGMPELGRRKRELDKRETHGIDGTPRKPGSR